MRFLLHSDPDVSRHIAAELTRQQRGLELIASENYVSPAVLEALGSVLTNKYAEGYPGKRYYGGNEHIDAVEELARTRAKKLFGAEHANVQPLSGAPANLAVYSALLKLGDTVLGMDLSHGGHLTHGHPVTFSAKLYRFVRYKTDPATGMIDYDQLHAMAQKEKPKLILAGYSAYSRDIDYERIRHIADEVGALTMADVSHIAGLIATGLMNNPVPVFDVVTTTTHKTLRGPRGGMILCKKEHAEKIDKAVFPGLQGGPHENVIAAIAVALHEAMEPSFQSYGERVLENAKALERVFKEHSVTMCFGGTDNHLLLVDLATLGITGQHAQDVLDRVGITVNKNMIPDDPRKPMDPSGIRLGTPAVTTRGLQVKDMERLGTAMCEVLRSLDDHHVQNRARDLVEELTAAYPLYRELP